MIPAVSALKLHLETKVQDTGAKTMKAGLISSIDSCFQWIWTNPSATVATALDPRFRLTSFTTDAAIGEVKSAVAAAAALVNKPTVPEPKDDEPSMEPPLKKARFDTSSVWAAWEESIATVASTTDAASNANRNITSDIETEVATYFSLSSTIPRKEDPLIWWRMNKLCFPLLCRVARIYLGAPPSIIQSKHIFSTAGDVYSPHRASLTPDNAERLIFLKCNLPLVGFDY